MHSSHQGNNNSNVVLMKQSSQDFWEIFRRREHETPNHHPLFKQEQADAISGNATHNQNNRCSDIRNTADDDCSATTSATDTTSSWETSSLEEFCFSNHTAEPVKSTGFQQTTDDSTFSEMDYNFLMGIDQQEAIANILSSSSNTATTDSQAMMLPTPIDAHRMNVVPFVIPGKGLLCNSELNHLRNMMMMTPLSQPFVFCPQVVVSSSTFTTIPFRPCDREEDASSPSCSTSSMSSAAPVSASATVASSAVCSWNKRFRELLAFREDHGHVNVPYDFPFNPPLAQWVKRQRHQYRLLKEGKHSNLTPYRLEQLESIDYCWDSRKALWLDRFYELQSFYQEQGHVRVSKRYRAPLAVWLKRQRHQGRLFLQGKEKGMTNMTPERLELLLQVGVKFSCK